MKTTRLISASMATAALLLAITIYRLQRLPPFSAKSLAASNIPLDLRDSDELVQLRPSSAEWIDSDGFENHKSFTRPTLYCNHALYFEVWIRQSNSSGGDEQQIIKYDGTSGCKLIASFRPPIWLFSQIECKHDRPVVLLAQGGRTAKAPRFLHEFQVDSNTYSGVTFEIPQHRTIGETIGSAIVLRNNKWQFVNCESDNSDEADRCEKLRAARLDRDDKILTKDGRVYQVLDTEMPTQTWFVERSTYHTYHFQMHGASEGFTFNAGTGILTTNTANIYVTEPTLKDSRLRLADTGVDLRFAEQPDGRILFLHPQGVMRFDHLWNRLDSPAWTARVAKAARFASTFENLQILFALLAPLLIIGLHLWRRTTRHGPWIALAVQLYAAWTIWIWTYGI
jgi:hypothetical protein